VVGSQTRHLAATIQLSGVGIQGFSECFNRGGLEREEPLFGDTHLCYGWFATGI
jgi:hypothetical protein